MTYSIVAKCSTTGQFGVAIQSHFFAVGNAAWAKAGVGAVATQALALIDHGPLGIELMAEGLSSEDALSRRLDEDEQPEIRQVAMIDSNGVAAAYTGSKTIRANGHIIGAGYSCQANLMLNEGVPQAMADAFDSSEGELASRLLSALVAGQNAGGDLRGKQSARILVVAAEPKEKHWEEVLVDIAVDDHPDPLAESARLLDMHSVYSHLGNDASGLELDFVDAEKYPEVAFWKGVELATLGKESEAKIYSNIALSQHSGWKELLIRCAEIGFFGINDETIRILLPNDH